MAEVLAVASGIAGLLSLTIEVYSVSSRYISCVQQASRSILDIQRELKVLKTILSELDKALEATEADALFKERPSVLSSIENTEEYREVLQRLQAKLLKESAKTGITAKLKSFTWPFSEERTQGILDVLRRHVNAFGQALSIDSFRVEFEILKEVQFLSKKQRENTQTRLLEWLSPKAQDVKQKQHDIFARRVGSTGNWLLVHEDFRRWSSDPSPPILWCSGDPGTGKTVLSSIVIDQLSRKCQPDKVVQAVIYCDYKDQANQTALNILGNITRQVIQGQSSSSKPLEDLYESLTKRSALPNLKDFEVLLHTVCRDFENVYLVIDALDELPPDRRKALLPVLLGLQKGQLAKVLVTSRPHPLDIQRAFQKQTKLEIRASDEDIQQFVRSQVDDDDDLLDAMDDDEQMKEEVIETITTAAQGIILLPVLQLKHLQGLFSKSQIRKALQTMPKDPFSMYDTTIERIKRQGAQRSELALAVLGWVSHARRPLLIDELRHALAVDFSDESNRHKLHQVDAENLVRQQLLIDVCAGLITIEPERKVVQLIHFTTQEYFNKNGGLHFPDVPSKMAGTCLTYLLVDEFDAGPCLKSDLLQRRLDQHPFYEYAACNWGNHVRGKFETKFMDLILELIRNDKKLCASVEACNQREREFFRWCNRFGFEPKNFGPLHCASSQGLDEVIKILLAEGKDPGEIDGTFKTPVHWAAWRGHCSSLQMLLDTGFDIHSPSDDGFLLLETAVDQDRREVVQLLLDRGFEINKKGFGGHTALLTAALMGRESLVQLLLQRDADCRLTSQFGETALLKAVLSGEKGIVKMLLDHGAEVTSVNSCGNTALHCAAYTGQVDIVELLLEAGAEIDLPTTSGATVLHLAANQGREDAVRYLIEKGASVEARTSNGSPDLTPLINEVGRCIPQMVQLKACGRGSTPLYEAALHGHEKVFHCLVDSGASLTTMDAELSTLLMATASSIGHGRNFYLKDMSTLEGLKSSALSIAEYLISHGADVNTSDKQGFTPLLNSAREGFFDLVKVLEKHNADTQVKTKKGFTMLHFAADGGHTDILERLLQQGPDIEAKTDEGCTALHLAAHAGELEVTRILLDHGANIEVHDNEGRTPLFRAVWSHDAEYVQFLLDRGADPEYRVFHDVDALYVAALNNQVAVMNVLIGDGIDLVKALEERKMIHSAAERGDLDVIRTLVQCGVGIDSPDENGDMALHYAAGAGQTDVVRYLLEAGADIDAPGRFKRTSLLYAAMEGRDEMVDFLCDKGARVDYICEKDMTALGLALDNRHMLLARLLANLGTPLDHHEDRIWEAYADGDCEMLQLLIENWSTSSPIPEEIKSHLIEVAAERRDQAFAKFVVERKYPVNGKELARTTAITTAIYNGDLDMVKLLVDNGANTTEAFYERNPVHFALQCGEEEIAHYLAEHDFEFHCNEGMFIAIRRGLYSFAAKTLVEGSHAPIMKLEDRDANGSTYLHLAAHHGHVDCTKLLLDNGADVEATDFQLATPLFSARLATSKLLLERGAHVDAMDKAGNTPLHHASGTNELESLERMELLISCGADVNRRDNDGDTPLHISSLFNYTDRVDLLIAKGSDASARRNDNNQPIHLAVGGPRYRWESFDPGKSISDDVVDLLLRNGADINAPGFHQRAPLHMAIRNPMLLQYLLEKGADLEAEDDENMTPLLHACVTNPPAQTFEILLKNGADIHRVDIVGRNALELALYSGTEQGAEILLKNGFPTAKSRISTNDFELHRAARGGYVKLLSLLLQQENVDIEQKNGRGKSPLACAILAEQSECVELLLNHGADPCSSGPCACPKKHFDPLVIVAARESTADILLCLIKHGADPNIRNHHNNTALMIAAEIGNRGCLEALLDITGIDVDAVDDDGDTALICAAIRGHFEITRLLLGRKDVDREIKNKKDQTAKETAQKKRHCHLVRLFEADEQGMDLYQVEAYAPGDYDSDDSSARCSARLVVRRRVINRSNSWDSLASEIEGDGQPALSHEWSDEENRAVELRDSYEGVPPAAERQEVVELPIR